MREYKKVGLCNAFCWVVFLHYPKCFFQRCSNQKQFTQGDREFHLVAHSHLLRLSTLQSGWWTGVRINPLFNHNFFFKKKVIPDALILLVNSSRSEQNPVWLLVFTLQRVGTLQLSSWFSQDEPGPPHNTWQWRKEEAANRKVVVDHDSSQRNWKADWTITEKNKNNKNVVWNDNDDTE